MDKMLEALEKFLKQGIIKIMCNELTNFSCATFSNNLKNNVITTIGINTPIRTLGSLLNYYEKKKNLTPKEICKYTKIPEAAYDRMKNQANDFTNYDKNYICLLVICFALTPSQTRMFLNSAHILLQPLSNSYDAAFDFFINEWHYTDNVQENINNFIKCVTHSQSLLKKYLKDNDN